MSTRYDFELYKFGFVATFSDLEQRLQPGGVQQTVEDLCSVNVLTHRLPHLLNHIRQDLTQPCDTPSHRWIIITEGSVLT